MPLIKCKIEINLSWLKEIWSEMRNRVKRNAVAVETNTNPPVHGARVAETKNASFKIDSVKRYVSRDILSAYNNIKFSKSFKQRFKIANLGIINNDPI